MNTKAINQKLVQDGRDLRYIEGFWAGYENACRELNQYTKCILDSVALYHAPADAEFMLAEARRKHP